MQNGTAKKKKKIFQRMVQVADMWLVVSMNTWEHRTKKKKRRCDAANASKRPGF